MSREVVGADGTVYEFPDDATDDEIGLWTAPSPQAPAGPGMLENALGFLPAAGGVAGGMIGGAGGAAFGAGFGGIPGAMGGSALGAAGGEAARQLIMRQLGLAAPESGLEAAGGIAGQGALAGGLAGAGSGIGAGARLAFKGVAPKAASLANAISPATPGAGHVAAKFMAKQIPGVGTAINVVEALAELSRSQATKVAVKSAATKAVKPVGKVVGAIKPSSTKMPKLPPAQATKGVDPTVPIKVAGKPKAVRLAKQRGVSNRELASRAPKSTTPDISGIEPHAKALEAAARAGNPAARIQAELAFEKELTKRGFSPDIKKALRRSAQEYLQGGVQ